MEEFDDDGMAAGREIRRKEGGGNSRKARVEPNKNRRAPQARQQHP